MATIAERVEAIHRICEMDAPDVMKFGAVSCIVRGADLEDIMQLVETAGSAVEILRRFPVGSQDAPTSNGAVR